MNHQILNIQGVESLNAFLRCPDCHSFPSSSLERYVQRLVQIYEPTLRKKEVCQAFIDDAALDETKTASSAASPDPNVILLSAWSRVNCLYNFDSESLLR